MARKGNNSVGGSTPAGENTPARATRPRRTKTTALPGPVETSVPLTVAEASDMSMAVTEITMPIEAASLDDARAFTHEDVARRAYELYAADGFSDGRDVEHWLAAEAELRGERR